MEEEEIKTFEGCKVKIEYHNGFVLIGTIMKVYRTSILFKTYQKESLININEIKTLVGGY